jgi:hypothetical protein
LKGEPVGEDGPGPATMSLGIDDVSLELPHSLLMRRGEEVATFKEQMERIAQQEREMVENARKRAEEHRIREEQEKQGEIERKGRHADEDDRALRKELEDKRHKKKKKSKEGKTTKKKKRKRKKAEEGSEGSEGSEGHLNVLRTHAEREDGSGSISARSVDDIEEAEDDQDTSAAQTVLLEVSLVDQEASAEERGARAFQDAMEQDGALHPQEARKHHSDDCRSPRLVIGEISDDQLQTLSPGEDGTLGEPTPRRKAAKEYDAIWKNVQACRAKHTYTHTHIKSLSNPNDIAISSHDHMCILLIS